jgi:hypothetical protein
MQIAVLEGYRAPRRSKMARRKSHRKGGKTALRKKMKSCARKHKVTSKGFWACVRGKKRR